MKFDTSLLLNLFAAAAMLVMGFRSFSKKHQMKFSDDEERAKIGRASCRERV